MLPGYELPSRTRLFCQLLKWFSVIFAIAYVILYFKIGAVDTLIAIYWDKLSEFQKEIIVYSDLKKTLLWSTGLLSGATHLLLLIATYRLFAELQKGIAFSLEVAKAIRFVGFMVMISFGVYLLLEPLMIGILTYDLPQGERTLSIAFNAYHARALILGTLFLFLIIGQIFTQAVRISDENRQIV